MKKIAITFCGHREVFGHNEVETKLHNTLKEIIGEMSPDLSIIFYCGGYGDFDGIAAKTASVIQSEYPERKIEKIYVTPYIGGKNDERNKSMSAYYDSIEYPPLESVPPRYAIIRRNEWMVDNSEIVIAYVLYSWGGAARTLSYAKRKKKRIIEIK